MKGSGKNACTLWPRDPKKPGGVTSGPHGVWTNKEARMKDPTVLGRVGKTMVKSSRRLVRRARAKDSKALRHSGGGWRPSGPERFRYCIVISKVAWRPSGHGRFRWFGPQNHCACRFLGLGLKTGGAFGAVGLARRRARGAIVKLASRRSEVVRATCPSDASIKL